MRKGPNCEYEQQSKFTFKMIQNRKYEKISTQWIRLLSLAILILIHTIIECLIVLNMCIFQKFTNMCCHFHVFTLITGTCHNYLQLGLNTFLGECSVYEERNIIHVILKYC